MRLAKGGGESSWRERGEESIGEKKKVCLPPPPSISHSGKEKKSCAEIPSLFEQKCNDAGGKVLLLCAKRSPKLKYDTARENPPEGFVELCRKREKKDLLNSLAQPNIQRSLPPTPPSLHPSSLTPLPPLFP